VQIHEMFWREFTTKWEHGYRPRCPAESVAGLEPANGNGYCMAPIFEHGCRMWFDASMQAEDGDVVLAEFHSTVVDRILAERANDAEFQKTYGDKRDQLGRAIKLLAYFRGVPFLVTVDSLTPLNGGQYGAGPPLGPSKILGVLRRFEC
jgi:hypothetical protein